MGDLTKNFNYSEFEVTDRKDLQHLNYIPNEEIKSNITSLVVEVIQPLRHYWAQPLFINSGYRCKEVNEAAKGAATSQHTKGEAADVCPFNQRNGTGDIDTVTALAKTAIDNHLPFDQCILYSTFVHFSHKRNSNQRNQVLYDKSYLNRGGKRL